MPIHREAAYCLIWKTKAPSNYERALFLRIGFTYTLTESVTKMMRFQREASVFKFLHTVDGERPREREREGETELGQTSRFTKRN